MIYDFKFEKIRRKLTSKVSEYKMSNNLWFATLSNSFT